MEIIAEASPTWKKDPAFNHDEQHKFTSEYAINGGEAEDSATTKKIHEYSQTGPIRISSNGVKPFKKDKNPLANYKLEKIIGKGVSGNVASAKHKGQKLVVKKIKVKDEKHLHDILRETAIQMELNKEDKKDSQSHTPSYAVVKKAVVVTNTVYIIMEAADTSWESELKEKPPSIKDLLSALQKLAKGYKQMHDKKYVHKDIKPDNVLVKDGNLLISDFGLTKSQATTDDQKEDHKFFGKMIFELLEEHSKSFGLTQTEVDTLQSLQNEFGCLSPEKLKNAKIRQDTNIHKLMTLAQAMFFQKMDMQKFGTRLDDLIREAQNLQG